MSYSWTRLANRASDYRPEWLPAPTDTDRDAVNGRGWWRSGKAHLVVAIAWSAFVVVGMVIL